MYFLAGFTIGVIFLFIENHRRKLHTMYFENWKQKLLNWFLFLCIFTALGYISVALFGMYLLLTHEDYPTGR